MGNWNIIRGVYFDGYMDVKSIKARYSQMTKPTASDSALRRWRILKDQPFSPQEDVLIMEGAKRFRCDWLTVRQVMLKHRDPISIGKRYQKLSQLRQRMQTMEIRKLTTHCILQN